MPAAGSVGIRVSGLGCRVWGLLAAARAPGPVGMSAGGSQRVVGRQAGRQLGAVSVS